MSKKPDEIALYDALRERARNGRNDLPRSPGTYALGEEAERLGIPYKRAHALMEKWCRAGWWEYGVTVRSGWFTREAPGTLRGTP